MGLTRLYRTSPLSFLAKKKCGFSIGWSLGSGTGNICFSPAGGPYWEKLCPTSWIPPEAVGRGQYPRQRAQFFPIRTDLVLVNNIFIFF